MYIIYMLIYIIITIYYILYVYFKENISNSYLISWHYVILPSISFSFKILLNTFELLLSILLLSITFVV